jgi:hypothetical protein
MGSHLFVAELRSLVAVERDHGNGSVPLMSRAALADGSSASAISSQAYWMMG